MTLHIVTANRLRDGAVVYLSPDGRWSVRLADAEIAADKDSADDLLASATRSEAVIAAYLMPVERAREGLRPLSTRERIRAAGGPSAAVPAPPAAEFPSFAGLAG